MAWSNLLPVRQEGSKPPLLCVQGDEASRLLPKYLDAETPFYAFLHQGGDGLRIPHDKVETIAAHYIKEMKEARPRGPYNLCGYSFGGIVAYEMAQQLRAAGDEVPLLALIDSYAPHLHEQAMRHDMPFYTPIKEFMLNRMVEHKLSEGKAISGRLRHFHIIDTYNRAIRGYRAKAYGGRLMVFRSMDGWGTIDMGWHDLANGGFFLYKVPGDHYSIIREPNIERLARVLQDSIDQTEESRTAAVP
jgi:thioesterase domain-containing protein